MRKRPSSFDAREQPDSYVWTPSDGADAVAQCLAYQLGPAKTRLLLSKLSNSSSAYTNTACEDSAACTHH